LNNDLSQIGSICGGSDPRNVTRKLYDLIDFPKWNTITFNFYLGENYMHSHSLPQPSYMNVNFLPYDMNEIYKSDLLIAAFGVSTYEFMALGMPIISIGHQESNAHASKVLNEKTKAICHLGLIDLLESVTLNETIGEFANDSTIRKLLSEKSKATLDFKGIDRIVEIIERI
jgi:spore coat polysaccharide biosynthesis predicted glycosyltransferase SpsG